MSNKYKQNNFALQFSNGCFAAVNEDYGYVFEAKDIGNVHLCSLEEANEITEEYRYLEVVQVELSLNVSSLVAAKTYNKGERASCDYKDKNYTFKNASNRLLYDDTYYDSNVVLDHNGKVFGLVIVIEGNECKFVVI